MVFVVTYPDTCDIIDIQSESVDSWLEQNPYMDAKTKVLGSAPCIDCACVVTPEYEDGITEYGDYTFTLRIYGSYHPGGFMECDVTIQLVPPDDCCCIRCIDQVYPALKPNVFHKEMGAPYDPDPVTGISRPIHDPEDDKPIRIAIDIAMQPGGDPAWRPGYDHFMLAWDGVAIDLPEPSGDCVKEDITTTLQFMQFLDYYPDPSGDGGPEGEEIPVYFTHPLAPEKCSDCTRNLQCNTADMYIKMQRDQ